MILAVRHGERGDKSLIEKEKKNVKLYFDPHLTELGALQAVFTASEIKTRILAFETELQSKGLSSGKKITPVILVSPFIRTIQTAYHIARNLDCFYENSIYIQPEISELLWDQQEFNIDPMPLLFSKNHHKLEDYSQYGLDFVTTGINLKNRLFSDPKLIQPKYPEKKEECINRMWTFLDKVPKMFFERFKFNEHVLIWVSHQFALASTVWLYENITPEVWLDSNVELCGIVDIRFPEPETNPQKVALRQHGTSPHLNIKA